MKLPIGFKIRQADHNVPIGEHRIKNNQDYKKGMRKKYSRRYLTVL